MQPSCSIQQNENSAITFIAINSSYPIGPAGIRQVRVKNPFIIIIMISRLLKPQIGQIPRSSSRLPTTPQKVARQTRLGLYSSIGYLTPLICPTQRTAQRMTEKEIAQRKNATQRRGLLQCQLQNRLWKKLERQMTARATESQKKAVSLSKRTSAHYSAFDFFQGFEGCFFLRVISPAKRVLYQSIQKMQDQVRAVCLIEVDILGQVMY